MNALSALLAAAVAVVANPAFAQFSWDAVAGACRDALGKQGLNSGGRGPCADLRGAHLEGANLRRLDLRGARLDGAKLAGATLQHSDLRGASLEGADLSRAVLSGTRLERASLAGARLVGAHLEYAVLTRAVLTGADLRNACLFGAIFESADLRGARFSHNRSMLEGARWRHALVAGDTLPFDASELAALEVQVRASGEPASP